MLTSSKPTNAEDAAFFDEMSARKALRALYEMWVSKFPTDPAVTTAQVIAKTRECILRDLRYRRDKPQFADVVREMRGQLVQLGKIRVLLEKRK